MDGVCVKNYNTSSYQRGTVHWMGPMDEELMKGVGSKQNAKPIQKPVTTNFAFQMDGP